MVYRRSCVQKLHLALLEVVDEPCGMGRVLAVKGVEFIHRASIVHRTAHLVLRSALFAPLQDLLPSAFVNDKLRLLHKQRSPVLAGLCLVVVVQVEYQGELIVYPVALYGLESHFLGNLFAVLVREGILCL